MGVYALHLMSRGPIYGGELAQRIDDATHGNWKPGAGAIYPILKGLVRRGSARAELRGGRKVYVLTTQGASRLQEVRARLKEGGGRFAELRNLTLEMIDPADRLEVMVRHLHRAIQPFVEMQRSTEPGFLEGPVRARALVLARAELEHGLRALTPRRGRRAARA